MLGSQGCGKMRPQGKRFHMIVFTVWTTWVQHEQMLRRLYPDSWGNNACLRLAKLCEMNLTRLIVIGAVMLS